MNSEYESVSAFINSIGFSLVVLFIYIVVYKVMFFFDVTALWFVYLRLPAYLVNLRLEFYLLAVHVDLRCILVLMSMAC